MNLEPCNPGRNLKNHPKHRQHAHLLERAIFHNDRHARRSRGARMRAGQAWKISGLGRFAAVKFRRRCGPVRSVATPEYTQTRGYVKSSGLFCGALNKCFVRRISFTIVDFCVWWCEFVFGFLF